MRLYGAGPYAELAGEHESGDCTVDCPHPDCTWVGVVDVTAVERLFDDVEVSARQLESVLL